MPLSAPENSIMFIVYNYLIIIYFHVLRSWLFHWHKLQILGPPYALLDREVG